MATARFDGAVREAENTLLEFLETFEAIQNNMRTERLPEFQAQLIGLAPEGFRHLIERLSREEPPEDLRQFRDSLTAGARHCGNALSAFLNADERTYSLTAMDMRRSLYRGLQWLYGARAHTPTLASYWLLPDALAQKESLETPSPDADVPVGIIHRRREAPLADYSLYVPESYTPSRNGRWSCACTGLADGATSSSGRGCGQRRAAGTWRLRRSRWTLLGPYCGPDWMPAR